MGGGGPPLNTNIVSIFDDIKALPVPKVISMKFSLHFLDCFEMFVFYYTVPPTHPIRERTGFTVVFFDESLQVKNTMKIT